MSTKMTRNFLNLTGSHLTMPECPVAIDQKITDWEEIKEDVLQEIGEKTKWRIHYPPDLSLPYPKFPIKHYDLADMIRWAEWGYFTLSENQIHEIKIDAELIDCAAKRERKRLEKEHEGKMAAVAKTRGMLKAEVEVALIDCDTVDELNSIIAEW